MTRRTAEQSSKVLSLNQYVRRATLGLPRGDRLDAAAELRAHLLERVTELEGEGYARDEAGYLAVRAMGDPGVTNRQLLGHFFTTPLGWLTLGAVLLVGGSVYANQVFRPAGIWLSTPRPMDDTAINRLFGPNWPRPEGSAHGPWTRTADLRFPQGTELVLAAWMSHGDASVRPTFSFPVELGMGLGSRKPLPSEHQRAAHARTSYQRHFRLVATAAPDASQKTCPAHTYQSGTLLYTQDRLQLPPGVFSTSQDGIFSFANLLSGFCMKDLGNRPEISTGPLPLNAWSKAYQIWGMVDGKQVSYALLLYPTDRAELPATKPKQAYVFSLKDRSWVPALH
jgi:hypothetical protein